MIYEYINLNYDFILVCGFHQVVSKSLFIHIYSAHLFQFLNIVDSCG